VRVQVWERFTGESAGSSGLPSRDENAWENESDVLMRRPGKRTRKARR